MTKKPLILILFLMVSLTGAAPAWAKRLALVIGNGNYAEKPLKNAVNDAELMRSTLADLGFGVSFYKNLDQRSLNRAITEFGRQISGSDMVLVYYAGHGMQSGANNYLIPVDAQIREPQDIESEGVAVRTILAKLEAAQVPANIVILDACRNNPYERARGSSRGLTRERTPIGTIVAYATEPGSTADDGDSRNGVYTQYLAKFIKQPGLTVHKVFEKTALAVETQTKGNQRPREENGLRGDYYFQLANLDLRPGAKPPVGGDLNLDDLENQSRSRAEQEAKQKADWAAWQGKMLAAYQRLDKLSGADLQVKGWESFLSSYGADNPYSNEDDKLRQQAQQKLASARAELERQNRPARGLARMKEKPMTISFSSSGDEVALDRAGDQEKHSPYAAAMAYMLAQPGKDLTQILNEAGNLVETKTQGKQHPRFSAPPNNSVILNPGREMTQTRRVALLIGNSSYLHSSQLANPGNDVRLVAAALKQAGFAHIQVEENLGVAEMKKALAAFKKETANADVALFYFAGLGLQVNKRDYLLPVDLNPDPDQTVAQGLELGLLQTELNDAAHLILLVDACFPGATAR